MKAKLQAKITEIVKDAKYESGKDITGMVRLKLVTTQGRVDTTFISAQLARLNGDLFLKEAIANQMKIGSLITITISDEEEPDTKME